MPMTTFKRRPRITLTCGGLAALMLFSASGAHAAADPVQLWRSSDQLMWKPETGKPSIEGHDPDMVLLTKATPSRTGPDAGTLLLAVVGADGLMVYKSVDQGRTWAAPAPVTFNGWSAELKDRKPTGPSIVQLEDGRVRVYFTAPASAERTQPWRKSPTSPVPDPVPVPVPSKPAPEDPPILPITPTPPGSSAQPEQLVGGSSEMAVYSAISNDGQTFAVEDGVRFKLGQLADPEVILLPAVRNGDGDTRNLGPWLMFLTSADKLALATSKDGLTWTRDETFAWSGASKASAVAAAGASSPRAVRLFATQSGRSVSSVFDPSTGLLTSDAKSNPPGNGQDVAVSPAGDGSFLLIGRDSAADKPQQPRKDFPRPNPSPPPLPTPK